MSEKNVNNLEIPKGVNEILQKFSEAGFEIYIVGGAVRDLLTGKEAYDWDFTTNAKPEEILKLLPEGFYDNQFGTVGLTTDEFPKPFEITTYRKEVGYSDRRRPDSIEWGGSLEEDLSRRDFTINALALGLSAKQKIEIVDPFQGQKDLENKVIRAVGNPVERFDEDALRMMRAIRITSELHFQIDERTFEAIKIHAQLINHIANERIKDELFKLFASDNSVHGIELLKESGLLQEIIPELMLAFGVEQKSPQRHHIYDVGTHLLKSLENCPSVDPLVRFATLLHDIGKPKTQKVTEDGVITFYNHEVVGAKMAKVIADRLRFSNEQRDRLWKLVRWHQFTVDERQTDSAIRRFIKRVGKENLQDILALRTGDRLGGGATETSWRLEEFKKRLEEVQTQPFSVKELKVNGKDVMEILKINSGPKVGEVLNKLFAEVEKDPSKNEREYLLGKIKQDA